MLRSDGSHCGVLMRQTKPSKATCMIDFCCHVGQYELKILHVTLMLLILANGSKIRPQLDILCLKILKQAADTYT